MTYTLLKFVHLLGAILIGAGLISVWLSDLRSRQVRELPQFAEAVRNIAVFYDGVVVPGAVLLLGSGAWLIAGFYDGWDFLQVPWLAGMVVLFAFEFIEGNTVTRVYFMRLRRLTRQALAEGRFTPALERARAEHLPSFTHYLDLPMLFLIVALGVIRPDNWTLFAVGSIVAILIATALTLFIPRLYPWAANAKSSSVGTNAVPTLPGWNLTLSWQRTIHLSRGQLKDIEQLIEAHSDEIKSAWKKHFGG